MYVYLCVCVRVRVENQDPMYHTCLTRKWTLPILGPAPKYYNLIASFISPASPQSIYVPLDSTSLCDSETTRDCVIFSSKMI